MTGRDAVTARLHEPFDVLIIGGGITGAGAARDAARRGLRVLLVEMDDLASGTSSRSSKLVHGGLRYLEQREFELVFEAVSERRILQRIGPHLVQPLGFLWPVYKHSRHGVWVMRIGMWVYDALALFRSPKFHRSLSQKHLRREYPALGLTDLTGAILYYDCATDDARLTLETALDAVAAGAVVYTHARVERLTRDDAGKITGAEVRDLLSGAVTPVSARVTINATGPWSDRTRTLGSADERPMLRPTKGVHIVLDAARLPLPSAVCHFHPRDGRVMFSIPWGDRTYIGTTDTEYEGDPGEVAADASDVAYLLEAANHYFPSLKLGPQDVISTWAGLRPLIAPPDQTSASQISREHEIRVDDDGLVTIAGGKLTTYRRMGAQVVDAAVKALGTLAPAGLTAPATDRQPLPGAVGWPRRDDGRGVQRLVTEAGQGRVSDATAAHLAHVYGMRGVDIARAAAREQGLATPLVPGRPEILAQVDHAVHQELAVTLCDVMIRRTQLFFRDHDQGLTATPLVARHLAGLLGWDEVRMKGEIAAYEAEVARSRRWRAEARGGV